MDDVVLLQLRSHNWSALDFSDRQFWLDRLREMIENSTYHPMLGARIQCGLVDAGVIDDNQFMDFLNQVRAEVIEVCDE